MTKIEAEGYFSKLLKRDKTATAIFTHILILTGFFLTLYAVGIIHDLPSDKNVLNWDALWYYSVKSFGYQFVPGRPCNLVFFPLFPYLWRLLHFQGLLMCLTNAIIFYFSFYILIKDKGLPFILILLLLSIPSCVFFNLPFSEAVFFLFGTLLLKGYENGSPQLRMLGFFGLSITRSVSMVFIPAILLTEFFSNESNGDIYKRWRNVAGDILSCAAGLLLTAYIQWYQTGKGLYFLRAQKFWNRRWIIPKFPLTTYNPNIALYIDTIAYIIGIIAVFYCIKWFLIWLKGFVNKANFIVKPGAVKTVYFSALYLSATVFLNTFFTFNDKAGVNIWSMNRYILCTPFAFIFIIWLYKNIKGSIKEGFIIAAFIISGVLFTGVFRYHYMLAYYLLFFASMAILIYFPKSRNWLLITYLVCLFLQISYFESFLANIFVG